MSNRKMNLDRPGLSSEQIRAKQNFEKVLSNHYLPKPTVWKSPWFWGPTGLASVGIAIMMSISYINSQNNSNDQKTTPLTASELPKDTECIHAPLKGENIPFIQYQVDPRKDEKIVLPSGTTIDIPKGSLVAEDPGSKVKIDVREFPDKASAFIAGIPMNYGKESAFESAGMLEVRGTQAGEPVAINPDKPLDIKLALTQDPEGFGFWYLNESSRDWTTHPAKIERSAETVKSTPENASKKIQVLRQEVEKADKNIARCDERLATLDKPAVETYKIPEQGHQKFDLEFDKKMYPELAGFENLVFEIIPTSGYDKSFTKKTWTEVKLEKLKAGYEMIFISSSAKMKVPVRPVLQGKELKEAEKEFDLAMRDFSTTLEKIEKERKVYLVKKEESQRMLAIEANQPSLENQVAAAVREVSGAGASGESARFQATRWGVYNSDKPINYPKPLDQEVALVWSGQYNVAEFKTVYVFNLDKNTRYAYGDFMRPVTDLGLHAKDDLVIVGIDKAGDLGFCELKDRKDRKALQKIVFSKNESEESPLNLLKKLLDENTATV